MGVITNRINPIMTISKTIKYMIQSMPNTSHQR